MPNAWILCVGIPKWRCILMATGLVLVSLCLPGTPRSASLNLLPSTSALSGEISPLDDQQIWFAGTVCRGLFGGFAHLPHEGAGLIFVRYACLRRARSYPFLSFDEHLRLA